MLEYGNVMGHDIYGGQCIIKLRCLCQVVYGSDILLYAWIPPNTYTCDFRGQKMPRKDLLSSSAFLSLITLKNTFTIIDLLWEIKKCNGYRTTNTMQVCCSIHVLNLKKDLNNTIAIANAIAEQCGE